jgi:trimeric autotransporter adhesin
VAHALGGGASVDESGRLTAPSYEIGGSAFSSIGDVLANVDTRVNENTQGLANLRESFGNLVDPGSGEMLAIVYDDARRTSATLGGADATAPVALTNVAEGNVEENSTDAVNGNQLWETNARIDAINDAFDRPSDVVMYDSPDHSTITLNSFGNGPVKLMNVADGTSQYDAVNYGQLTKLQDQVNDIDDRLSSGMVPPVDNDEPGAGGSRGSDLIGGTGNDGSVTPADPGTGNGNVAIGSGANVRNDNGTAIGAGAMAGGENSTAISSGAKATGDNSTAIGANSSASGQNSVALGAGSVARDANTVSVGDVGSERRIVNVADGINDTDAVNKRQLDDMRSSVSGQINDVARKAYSGVAAATALTMIPEVDLGKTMAFGIGTANYKGYQAVAFGSTARIRDNLKVKAGVGVGGGETTMGVGASYQW